MEQTDSMELDIPVQDGTEAQVCDQPDEVVSQEEVSQEEISQETVSQETVSQETRSSMDENSGGDDVQSLTARIAQLEAELERRDTLAARMARECEEFEHYFPEVSLRELPDRVWTQVHGGVPLAAAYALYERGLANEKRRIERQNACNTAHTVGVPSPAGAGYFSPAQVRAMSRDEVREHYDRIFESMRHWQ